VGHNRRAMSEDTAKGGYRLKHGVEPNQLPFLFDMGVSLYGWNFLNFAQGAYTPNAAMSAEWNRGAYIVQALGYCGVCHTPKGLTGGDKSEQFLQGGVLQEWLAPDITPRPTQGVGIWSREDIADYLKTGVNRFDIASGPMVEEVVHSSQYWPIPT
jgi:mono/diheme cytochrome c family protein